jgi:hypothetical protein
MATATAPRQGDLALLDDPIAKELLVSQIPARLAYTWKDGTPRVVPIAFHWTGEEIVLGTPPESPKMTALHTGDHVALTIDTNTFPFHVLMIRGTVKVDVVDGVPTEYTEACKRYLGAEMGVGWSAQMGGMFPKFGKIAIKPDWVGVVDYETRFPSEMAKHMA